MTSILKTKRTLRTKFSTYFNNLSNERYQGPQNNNSSVIFLIRLEYINDISHDALDFAALE